MNETQTLLQSLTIKALMVLITMILAKTGYDVAANQATIADIATNGAALIIVLVAGWARIRATKQITRNGAK